MTVLARATGLLLLLLLAGTADAATRGKPAAPSPQAVLERHLADDVPYWLDEPRLHEWLRQRNAETAGLDAAAIAELARQWQRESAAGSGPLVDRIASRFASKYLAEVQLRADGAWLEAIVLDRRGLVAAAAEIPEVFSWAGDPLLVQVAADPAAPWQLAGRVASEGLVRAAVPLADPDSEQSLGTLLLVIDMALLLKLPAPAP